MNDSRTEHTKPTHSIKSRLFKEFRAWIGFALFLVVVYFTSNVIQNRLGETAFTKTGLPNNTLQQALLLAKEQNKRVVADLSAYWCGTCRKFDQTVLSDPRVNKVLTSEYIFARIDSESPEAASFIDKYQARGYPTIMLLEANGNAVRRLPLTFSASEFLQNLN